MTTSTTAAQLMQTPPRTASTQLLFSPIASPLCLLQPLSPLLNLVDDEIPLEQGNVQGAPRREHNLSRLERKIDTLTGAVKTLIDRLDRLEQNSTRPLQQTASYDSEQPEPPYFQEESTIAPTVYSEEEQHYEEMRMKSSSILYMYVLYNVNVKENK